MAAQDRSRIAIIGAMSSEIRSLRESMQIDEQGTTAGFRWWAGSIAGRRVVLAQGGMGKVAAAACVQRLIDSWQVSCVVVCGLAGGLDDRLHAGDIVVGDALVQHDMDASPIFPRFQLPGLDIDTFRPAPALVDAAYEAAAGFLADMPIHPTVLARNGIKRPRVLQGLIATGDQFIEDRERDVIRKVLPEAICVEMEGAAIAQVCYLNDDLPCCVVRIMSDNADDKAAFDFLRFVEEVAPVYVHGIVTRLVPKLP